MHPLAARPVPRAGDGTLERLPPVHAPDAGDAERGLALTLLVARTGELVGGLVVRAVRFARRLGRRLGQRWRERFGGDGGQTEPDG